MVAASSALGIEAILGDVCALPFPDNSFDAVVAAWMLYHVRPLDKGLTELTRVLRPGGRLVAITNGRAHLKELWNAVGVDNEDLPFSVENGANHLRSYFSEIERHDVTTFATFQDRATAAAYLYSIDRNELVGRLPDANWPLRAQGATAVFVADKTI
jgi:ubiquinone/menaquinone biosynthesis C-methylase UbiE